MMVQTAMPRMPARVVAELLCSESGSRTAAELVGNLAVSPASVSKAVGYLEQLGMVRRERFGRAGRERCAIDGDVWYRSAQSQVRTCELWAARVQTYSVPIGPPGFVSRQWGRFCDLVGKDMAGSRTLSTRLRVFAEA